jgi:hypothetical protein
VTKCGTWEWTSGWRSVNQKYKKKKIGIYQAYSSTAEENNKEERKAIRLKKIRGSIDFEQT